MKEIEFDAGDQMYPENACNKIDTVTSQIAEITNRDGCSFRQSNVLYGNIASVITHWIGAFHAGWPKEECLQKSFYEFYKRLLEFLLKFQPDKLYQGRIYRYIGYSSEDYQDEFLINSVVNPKKPYGTKYYSSWSKTKNLPTITKDLIGPKTLLICDIPDNMYGIDLSKFVYDSRKEKEIVFPTLLSFIKIEYIEEFQEEEE